MLIVPRTSGVVSADAIGKSASDGVQQRLVDTMTADDGRHVAPLVRGMTPRLLDMYCGAGGCSLGYERSGFEVVGVDLNPKCERHYRRVCAGEFIAADALEYVREHGHKFDAIHASPPCQAHTSLRALQPDKTYPDLIPATRAALIATGKPYVIENVPRAPLGGGSTYLLMLCGTMFGLVTPDGSAEIRRHRLFETNWCFGLRPACQHGGEAISVSGTGLDRKRWLNRCSHCGHTRNHHGGDPEWGTFSSECDACSCAGFVETRPRQVITVAGHDYHSMAARNQRRRGIDGDALTTRTLAEQQRYRRAMNVTGNTPQINTVRNTERETFTADEARYAMGIDLPMIYLSQAIPPAYTAWLGARLIASLDTRPLGV